MPSPPILKETVSAEKEKVPNCKRLARLCDCWNFVLTSLHEAHNLLNVLPSFTGIPELQNIHISQNPDTMVCDSRTKRIIDLQAKFRRSEEET